MAKRLGGIPGDPGKIIYTQTLNEYNNKHAGDTLPPSSSGVEASQALTAHQGGIQFAGTTATDPGWQDFGNCLGVDPDLFFPERGASTREAKEVCQGCVVRDECLEYALASGEKSGIWGGLSERERRRIRRQRSLAREVNTETETSETPAT